MNIYRIITAILLAIIIAGSIVFNTKVKALNSTILTHKSAVPDTVVKIDSTLYLVQVEKTKSIELENKKLSDLIKVQNYKLKSNLKFTALLEDSIKNVTTKDSVNNTPVSSSRYFVVDRYPFFIDGLFDTSFPWHIDFTRIAACVDLDVAILEDENGDWRVLAETGSENLTITDLKSKVVPYKKPWFKYLRAGLGVQVYNGGAQIYGAAGYKNYLGTLGINEHGTTLGVLYLF